MILDLISEEQFMRITRNHGVDKVLFGSDSPWSDQTLYVNILNGFPLTEQEKQMIFHDNAAKLLY